MATKSTTFESWEILKKNKNLFIPNIFILVTNFVMLFLFLYFSGLGESIFNNQQESLKDIIISLKFLILFTIYILVNSLIDNYFLTAKYGMIKEVLLKKKANLNKGWKFAKKYYWTTLGIHLLSVLIITIPMLILAVLMLSLLPVSSIVAITLFIPLLITYVVYVTIKLLFVYPVMAFEKEGAYKSLEEDFHFVKTHFSHTFVTWLVILVVSIIASIIKSNIGSLSNLFSGQLFFMGLLAIIFIVTIELVVSVWEQVYIFNSYLIAKKKKRKRVNRKIKRSKASKKSTLNSKKKRKK